MCKTLNTGIKLPINWCRISSNSSMCQISTLLEVFFRLVSGSNSQPHSEATFFFWMVGLENTCVFIDSKYFSIFTLGLGKMIQFDVTCAYFSNGWFFETTRLGVFLLFLFFPPFFLSEKKRVDLGDLWSIQWEPGRWRLKWLPSEHVLRPWRTGGGSFRWSEPCKWDTGFLTFH